MSKTPTKYTLELTGASRVTTVTNALRQAINLSSYEEEKMLTEETLEEVTTQVPVKPRDGAN